MKSLLLIWVNTVRTGLMYLLLVAFPLSSWAGAVSPCSGQDSVPAQEIVKDAGVQHDAHANHAAAQDVTSHHHGSQTNNTQPSECRCCADCMSLCVFSGCGVVAIAQELTELPFPAHGQTVPFSANFLPGPTVHSLFRPPIQHT